MKVDKILRERLVYLLQGKGAHVRFDDVIKDFPEELHGRQHPDLPYTAWQLLEHLRIAQWDILEFSRNEEHVSPQWPKGYWPETTSPPDEEAWTGSVERFRSELKEMEKLVADPQTDLFLKIPHGDGQNILREALLVADHNAYHLGQLVILRKLFGAWK